MEVKNINSFKYAADAVDYEIMRQSGLLERGEAIRQETERAEKRRGFLADAYTAHAEFQRSGKGYALADVKAHYRAKLQGRRSRKPKLRSWPR